MATTEEGSLNTIAVTTAQSNKVASINAVDAIVEKAVSGTLEYDLASATGDVTPTEAQAQNGRINFFGATSGNVVIQLDVDIRKSWWMRDESTGNVVSVEPTAGANPVTLPKDMWVQILSEEGGDCVLVGGWSDPADTPAITDGTNWSETTGREIEVRKEDAEDGSNGGFVSIQGAYEKATSDPAPGDVILTLPTNWRPTIPVAFCCVAEPDTGANADVVFVEVGTNGAITLLNIGVWAGTIQNVPIDLSSIKFHAGN